MSTTHQPTTNFAAPAPVRLTQQEHAAAPLRSEQRPSDELYRIIVESSRDCIMTLSVDGLLLSVNTAAAQLLRAPQLESVSGQSWIELWTDDQQTEARSAVKTAAGGGRGRFVGSTGVTGEPRWWDVLITPIQDSGREPERLLAVARDITEQRTASEQLRRKEAQLSDFVEHASIGLYRVGPDGIIQWANQAEMELLGYAADEYIGQHLERFHADQEIITDLLARLGRGERLRDYPARLVARDGAIRNVVIDSSPLWESGRLIHTQCFTRDVTAARRAEVEIHAREERMRRLMALMPAAVYTCDAEGRITFYNRRAVELWGREPLLNDPCHRFCGGFRLRGPDGTVLPPEATPMAHALIDGRTARNAEIEIERENGSRVFVQANIDPLRNEDGTLTGAINVFQDVSDLKLREKEIERLNGELRRRLEEFEALIRTAPVGIGVATDARCQHIWGNPAFTRMLRVSPTENLSKSAPTDSLPFVILRGGNPVPEGDLPMQRACREGIEVQGDQLEIIRSDGSVMHELAFASPLFDPAGEVRGCIGVFLDISHQKHAEAALRRSESLFRQLADAMPQMVWAARPDGFVDYYNRRWYDYTGLREASGDFGWAPVVHPDDLARSKAVYDEAIRTEKLYQIEFRLRDRASNEYRWFLGRALPIRDEDGRIIRWFGTCTDIEDQKRAEEKLERAVAERTETLRATIAELEAFSYSISHDLRGPLRSMQGFAEVLHEDFATVLGPDGCRYLQRIRAAASRMDRLIQDVLTLTRVAGAELAVESVDLDALVRGILETYPNLHAQEDSIMIESKLPWVQGNQAALTQCLSNLLGNAVKFVPAERKPRIRIWTEEREDFTRVLIADNGIGISANAQERIFRMFERVNDNYEGTGIGLAIVKTTVTRLGGRVGVSSQIGVGSTFWLDLHPANAPSAPP